jgi:hypothetical protein
MSAVGINVGRWRHTGGAGGTSCTFGTEQSGDEIHVFIDNAQKDIHVEFRSLYSGRAHDFQEVGEFESDERCCD